MLSMRLPLTNPPVSLTNPPDLWTDSLPCRTGVESICGCVHLWRTSIRSERCQWRVLVEWESATSAQCRIVCGPVGRTFRQSGHHNWRCSLRASSRSSMWSAGITAIADLTTQPGCRPIRSIIADDDRRTTLVGLPGRTGSRSTSRISPRSIGEAIRDRRLPGRRLSGGLPLLPGGRIVLLQFGLSQQTDGLPDDGRARLHPGGPDLAIDTGHLLLAQTDAQLHVSILLEERFPTTATGRI